MTKLPETLTCQFLSINLPIKYVTCSHIFQKQWGHLRNLIQLADINDPRNTLLLSKPIELLFDRGQIIFLWNSAQNEFQMKILDPSQHSVLLSSLFTSAFPGNVVPDGVPNVTLGSLEDFPLNVGPNSPFKRCLAFHASLAKYQAVKVKMWINAEEFTQVPEDAWSPGIAENPALSRQLRSWLDDVRDAEEEDVSDVILGEDSEQLNDETN